MAKEETLVVEGEKCLALRRGGCVEKGIRVLQEQGKVGMGTYVPGK